MSAITKIFGAIVSLVTGLLGNVLGIFSKNKKGEFFLELDPTKDGAAAPSAAVADAPPAPKKMKAPKKAKKAKAPKPAKQSAAPAPTPQPAAISAVNQALNMPKPKVATIEPLDIPKFGPRRRPGANMQSFLDMAKTVKS